MIFIDRSIPKSVAESLKMVRNDDILWLEDLYPHDAKDEAWIPDAGINGWLTVSRDKKIRSRRWQRLLLREHGVGCFIFHQKQNPTRWEYYKLFGACLDEMERLHSVTELPYMFLIGASGRIRQVDL